MSPKRIAIPLRKNRLDELLLQKGRVYLIAYDRQVADYYRRQKRWSVYQVEIINSVAQLYKARPGAVGN